MFLEVPVFLLTFAKVESQRPRPPTQQHYYKLINYKEDETM